VTETLRKYKIEFGQRDREIQAHGYLVDSRNSGLINFYRYEGAEGTAVNVFTVKVDAVIQIELLDS
jgi:hypothetical protein